MRAITVTFREPIEPGALASRTRIALRPLPGLGDDGLRILDADDFEVKALDRTSLDAPASYTLVLREPIPLGMSAEVRIALSLDDAAAEARHTFTFRTAEPFRPTQLGCAGRTLPVSPKGTVYTAEGTTR